MTVQTVKSHSNAEKFQSAEQLWFWFLYSKATRNGFRSGSFSSTKRACELLDVETLITKLYLSGRLTDKQLAVMKEFGDKRRTPHQHIWSENRKAAIWRDAMHTLETAATAKGWINNH
ncbi:MAG: hypothetical protein LBJ73_05120 [Rickettsiales bacterium]|jgi:hypothetical protein|nr:hypothetical protein [Rickettsiales bacterium]